MINVLVSDTRRQRVIDVINETPDVDVVAKMNINGASVVSAQERAGFEAISIAKEFLNA